jgi:hypothetical protein
MEFGKYFHNLRVIHLFLRYLSLKLNSLPFWERKELMESFKKVP